MTDVQYPIILDDESKAEADSLALRTRALAESEQSMYQAVVLAREDLARQHDSFWAGLAAKYGIDMTKKHNMNRDGEKAWIDLAGEGEV